MRGDYSEQFQARYHEHMIEMIEARPWLWATHVWNLADFAADGRDEGGVPGRNQKGLVNFDRTVKKDAFYAYKAAWSTDPFVHIAGRRYVDRAEETTDVTVYSNQPDVSLWVDGKLVGTQSGLRVFRFEVPLSGEHELTARSGALIDTIADSTRRRAEPRLLGGRLRGRQLVRLRRAADPRRLSTRSRTRWPTSRARRRQRRSWRN